MQLYHTHDLVLGTENHTDSLGYFENVCKVTGLVLCSAPAYQFLSGDAFGYCAMSQQEFLVCEKRCRNSCYTSLHSNPIYGNLFKHICLHKNHSSDNTEWYAAS